MLTACKFERVVLWHCLNLIKRDGTLFVAYHYCIQKLYHGTCKYIMNISQYFAIIFHINGCQYFIVDLEMFCPHSSSNKNSSQSSPINWYKGLDKQFPYPSGDHNSSHISLPRHVSTVDITASPIGTVLWNSKEKILDFNMWYIKKVYQYTKNT